MKLPIITLLLSVIVCSVYAQVTIEEGYRPEEDCRAIAYAAVQKIPAYYQNNEIDSIIYHTKYWENACGESELSRKTTLLFEIEREVFSEDDIDYYLFESLLADASAIEDYEHIVNYSTPAILGSDYVKYAAFTNFTIRWANDLLQSQNYPVCSDTRAILLLYAGRRQEFFDILKRDECKNSKLSVFYNEQVRKAQSLSNYHVSAFSGIWVPLGKARLLGPHPSIGFSVGFQPNRFLYDITILFRFLQSKSPYLVNIDGSQLPTDHFFWWLYGTRCWL